MKLLINLFNCILKAFVCFLSFISLLLHYLWFVRSDPSHVSTYSTDFKANYTEKESARFFVKTKAINK